MLEEAYTASRYSAIEYGRGDAEECLEAASRILEALGGVEGGL